MAYSCVTLVKIILTVVLVYCDSVQSRIPVFEQDYETVILEESSAARIECIAIGELPMTHLWYDQDSGDVGTQANASVYSLQGTNSSFLVFNFPRVSDAGLYTCMAMNKHGLASKVYRVSVNRTSGIPMFEQDYETVYLEEGFASIECSATGEPPMSYLWYDQGSRPIGNDANGTMYVSNGSLLIFNHIRSSDAGLYTCTASNAHGLASKVFEVSFNRTSDNITGNGTITRIDVFNVTENSVTFYIETSGDLKELHILYTEKVETYKRDAYIKDFKSGSKHVIGFLVPGGKFTFKFQSTSYQGVVSGWSQNYTVVLFPDVPDVIYRSLGDGNLQIEWFRKFDDVGRATIDEYSLTYNTLRIYNGNTFLHGECIMNVQIPFCGGTRYTISGLSKNTYYEIRLQAHTSTGYGKPHRSKIFVV